jgi:hypothetical protein
MTGHLRLISELYSESKRLSEEILRQVARDVASRIDRERESMWAGPKGGDGEDEPSGNKGKGRKQSNNL